MSLLRLVPLLCAVLLPFQGLAQSETPATPPGSMSQPPIIPAPGAAEADEAANPAQGQPRGEIVPPGERLDSDTWHESDDTGSPAVRIPVGTLLGTMGALVGTLPGLAIAFTQFCLDSCSPNRTVETLGLVVASAGALLGGTWVIDRTGDWLGGQGRFWPTALGMVLGTAVGAVAAVAIAPSSETASVIPAVLGPALGGTIAYEISSFLVRREAGAATASSARVAPLVAVSSRGGLIGGLAGTF